MVLELILLSGSRSTWLSVVVFWTILLGLQYKELNLKIWIPTLVVLSVVIFLIVYHTPTIHQRVVSMLQGNSSGRDLLWGYFIAKIPDNFFWGHGLASPYYLGFNEGKFLYPHNLTIEILYSFGFIGFVGALWIAWRILRAIYTGNQALKPYLLASFITLFGVQQQLETSILIHKVAGPMLFFYLGLLQFFLSKKRSNLF